MALFTDIEPELEPRRRRGARPGWIILAIALIGLIVVALVPAPYVIEQPGPVYNTLGTVTIDKKDVPLIQIADSEKTYATKGSLDMLTVSIRGNRENLPNWLEIATAYFDPSKAVVPVDEIYPAGESVDQSNEQGAIQMANSQKEAVAAALTELGYTIPSTLSIAQVQKGAPADGELLPGDVVLSVNGKTFPDVTGLRKEIAENGIDKPAVIDITRGGVPMTVSITPVLSAGEQPTAIVGVVVGSEYSFPFDVKIQLENVGGPSAGMMFALGIVDKLTPGELNGGKQVAGTGTISATGEVGPIGGIRQKLYGAKEAGADFFLAPSDNCNEVTGHIPDGLTVLSVSTLDDSLAALKAISSGKGVSSLPTCPVG